jgi:hypothetical protein
MLAPGTMVRAQPKRQPPTANPALWVTFDVLGEYDYRQHPSLFRNFLPPQRSAVFVGCTNRGRDNYFHNTLCSPDNASEKD